MSGEYIINSIGYVVSDFEYRLKQGNYDFTEDEISGYCFAQWLYHILKTDSKRIFEYQQTVIEQLKTVAGDKWPELAHRITTCNNITNINHFRRK